MSVLNNFYLGETMAADISTLLTSVPLELRFRYQGMSFSDFSVQYAEGSGSIRRKFTALPLCLVHLVKAVCHYVKMFFEIPRSLYYRDLRYSKVEFYHSLRCVQASLGFLLILFHDKCGSFLVGESMFQRSCYNDFEKTHGWVPSLTLGAFKDLPDREKSLILRKFLKRDVEEVFEKLRHAEDAVLERVTLRACLEKPDILDAALLSERELNALTLSEVGRAGSLDLIVERLKSKRGEETNIPDTTRTMEDIPISRLILAPASDPNMRALLRTISAGVLKQFVLFARKEQIEEISLRSFEETLGELFTPNDREFFSLFTADQISVIIDKLNSNQLAFITDEQLKGFHSSTIGKIEYLRVFFPLDKPDTSYRMALLLKNKVIKAIQNSEYTYEQVCARALEIKRTNAEVAANAQHPSDPDASSCNRPVVVDPAPPFISDENEVLSHGGPTIDADFVAAPSEVTLVSA